MSDFVKQLRERKKALNIELKTTVADFAVKERPAPSASKTGRRKSTVRQGREAHA